MVIEGTTGRVVEHLKKQGPINTFRLASELDIDRSKILNIIKKLEEKQAVEVKSGIVKFLKFPSKEKKVGRKKLVKKVPSKPKNKAKRKAYKIKPRADIKNKIRRQAENIKKLKKRIRKLEQAPPKIVRRRVYVKSPPKVIRKNIVKKVPVIKRIHIGSKKLKEQTDYIQKLEEKIKELRKKASKPKIIRKTIVKEVPKVIRKTIVKKVPIKVKEKIPKKEKTKPKKFKLPKINLSGLGRNIKKLHVPGMLKK